MCGGAPEAIQTMPTLPSRPCQLQPSAVERLPVVVARSVSKTFRIPEDRRHTLKERALHPRRRIRHNEFQALNDVSFAIESRRVLRDRRPQRQRQEHAAEVPRRASTRPTGEIWRRGRLSTLIELGVGFNPEMAARDNVVMNGIMLGLSPREARKRYESVIEFAELQEFKDLKLKNYSSGMHVRLAFSVAVQVDADILMVDEVLAVGDAAFQQKCFDVFNDLRDKGRTIVFVTHDMGALQRFCHRALLLERGNPVYMGEPHEVADRYLEINFGRDPQAIGAGGDGHAGDGEARIAEVWMESETGERLSTRSATPSRDAQGASSVHGRRHRSIRQRLRLQRGAPGGRRRDDRGRQRTHAASSRPARRSCSRSRSTTCSLQDATRRCSSSPTAARVST